MATNRPAPITAAARICDSFIGTGYTGVVAIKAGKSVGGIEHELCWFEAAVTPLVKALEPTK
jgi:hypothetical protein